jgi:hypothetical protein
MVGLRALWQLHTTAAMSLLIFSLILGKSKKFSHSHRQKNVILKPKFLQKLKITGGRIFLLDWPKSPAKSNGNPGPKAEHHLKKSKSHLAVIESVIGQCCGFDTGKVLGSRSQGFGSGSGLDPDSIRSVDPDPYWESGSGYRRAKMTHKRRKNLEISCLEVLYVLC